MGLERRYDGTADRVHHVLPSDAASSERSGRAVRLAESKCEVCSLPDRPIELDSTGVKFQQAWRILSLVQIRMSSLQKLAQEHTLPALSLTPLASESLPKELRDRQKAVPGVESNEGLFRMFSESMETRQNVRRAFPLPLSRHVY